MHMYIHPVHAMYIYIYIYCQPRIVIQQNNLSVDDNIYIYIYIYCRPQTDCFVLSLFFSVDRHSRCYTQYIQYIYIYIYIYIHTQYMKWGLNTLAKEFTAAARIMQKAL